MTGYVERLSRYEREVSQAAEWCQRLALFSIPFFLIVVLGHRFGAIDTIATFWLLGLGVLILIAALIAGVRGFHQLWTHGHEAGLKSLRGMALAALLLSPFLYQGVQAFLLPQLYDISTDLEDPPVFDNALEDRTEQMNPILDATEPAKLLQLKAYPRVAARRYPLDSVRVFKEVVDLIADREWILLTSETEQGNAQIDLEGSGLLAKPNVDSKGMPLRIPLPKFKLDKQPAEDKPQTEQVPAFEAVQVSPIGRSAETDNSEQEERYIEAVATSLIFGFENDVVIRLVEEEDGTLVDMRSVSRWGSHDLGSNSARIMNFLSDLDVNLQGLSQ